MIHGRQIIEEMCALMFCTYNEAKAESPAEITTAFRDLARKQLES